MSNLIASCLEDFQLLHQCVYKVVTWETKGEFLGTQFLVWLKNLDSYTGNKM